MMTMPSFVRKLAQCGCRFSGNFFGQLKIFVIFGLAKVLRSKKFRQADDCRALFRRIANKIDRPREILLRISAALHLHQRDFCFGLFRFSHVSNTAL